MVRRAVTARKMHRFMVNIKSAHVFNGVLESWNLARNGKKNAKMRANNTCASRVYHAVINHAAPLTRLYPILTHHGSAQRRAPAATSSARHCNGVERYERGRVYSTVPYTP